MKGFYDELCTFIHRFLNVLKRLFLNLPIKSPAISGTFSIFCFEIYLNRIILTHLKSLPVEKLNGKISFSLIVQNFKCIYITVCWVLISRPVSTVRTINLKNNEFQLQRYQSTNLFVDIKWNWIVFAVIIRSNFQVNIYNKLFLTLIKIARDSRTIP